MKSLYKISGVLPQPSEFTMETLKPENYCPNKCRWFEAAVEDNIDVQYTPYWDEDYDDLMNFLFTTVVHEFSISHTQIHHCPGCGVQVMRSTGADKEAK